VETAHLGLALRGLVACGFQGFNVTIPHKQNIIPHLDELSTGARQIGAVNTIRVKDGKLVGLNTDTDGWAEDCQRMFALRGAHIAIAGAGGAARAVAVAAAHAGVKSIAIINRTVSAAEQLAATLQEHFPDIRVVPAPRDQDGPGRDLVAGCGLLVNTTPIGMGAPDDSLAVPATWLRGDLAVYDTVYTPATTATLKMAQALGAPHRNGLGMLARQGALAFEAWTAIQPDVTRMEATLRLKLGC
jgi:shikimate dehydrogenase